MTVRQLSHEQAQLLAVMVELGWCDPQAGPDEVARLRQDSEFAADEIRAALTWTRNAAYREYHFAQDLLTRLPAVFTALDTGLICRLSSVRLTEDELRARVEAGSATPEERDAWLEVDTVAFLLGS